MPLTHEQIVELLPHIDNAFDRITNGIKARSLPIPLTVEELGKTLNVDVDPEKVDYQALILLGEAIETLSPKAENYPLIAASYLNLVQEKAPWALEKQA